MSTREEIAVWTNLTEARVRVSIPTGARTKTNLGVISATCPVHLENVFYEAMWTLLRADLKLLRAAVISLTIM